MPHNRAAGGEALPMLTVAQSGYHGAPKRVRSSRFARSMAASLKGGGPYHPRTAAPGTGGESLF